MLSTQEEKKSVFLSFNILTFQQLGRNQDPDPAHYLLKDPDPAKSRRSGPLLLIPVLSRRVTHWSPRDALGWAGSQDR